MVLKLAQQVALFDASQKRAVAPDAGMRVDERFAGRIGSYTALKYIISWQFGCMVK